MSSLAVLQSVSWLSHIWDLTYAGLNTYSGFIGSTSKDVRRPSFLTLTLTLTPNLELAKWLGLLFLLCRCLCMYSLFYSNSCYGLIWFGSSIRSFVTSLNFSKSIDNSNPLYFYKISYNFQIHSSLQRCIEQHIMMLRCRRPPPLIESALLPTCAAYMHLPCSQSLFASALLFPLALHYPPREDSNSPELLLLK